MTYRGARFVMTYRGARYVTLEVATSFINPLLTGFHPLVAHKHAHTHIYTHTYIHTYQGPLVFVVPQLRQREREREREITPKRGRVSLV